MTASADALRRGWTTGACAAAAALAAYRRGACSAAPASVAVELPKGQTPSFAVAEEGTDAHGFPWAGVVKDAGDDPDVTHGALVWASLGAGPPGSGLAFRAGTGVGTATLPGLPIGVGEPAINPRPREIIAANLRAAVGRAGEPDLVVTVGIRDGAALAAQTWNPRLGIEGGLSVLGTTGVVVPYSCSAWIDSIHRGVDVARRQGYRHILAATGSTSEATLQRLYPDRPQTATVDMGDFAGGLLKYLRRYPVPALSLGGGFAKLAKLAQGARDLHSRRSQADLASLAAWLAELGADAATVEAAGQAASAGAIRQLADQAAVPLGDRVAERARAQARQLAPRVAVEVVAIDRAGTVVGRAGADEVAAVRAEGDPCMS